MRFVERAWDALAAMDYRFRIADYLPNESDVILKYHSIGSEPYSGISTDQLQSDLEYLSHRYQIADLSDIVDSPDDRRKRIILTFDDGYRDFYTNVLPILEELDIKATIFIITRTLEHPDFNHAERSQMEFSYLSRDQVENLASHPLVTIGNHTRTHPYLDDLSQAEFQEEIVGSKAYLEREFDITVDRFCYPAGRLSDTVVEAVASTHSYAVTTRPRLLPSDPNPYRLPRLNGPRHNITWAVTDLSERVRTCRLDYPWIK